MKKLYLIISILTLIKANTQDNFLKILNEVSEIATQTKLNIDKTPSNVEIINREFIVRSGAKTLLDLLQYLPGIEISMSSSGKKEIIVRGNKSTFRDKIKFLINGHEVTNNIYSNQFYYYNFPASLIKRVEFTKTPDAVLYGDKAYLGVINIITLNEIDDNEINFFQSNKRETSISIFKKLNNDNTLLDIHYQISDPNSKSVKTYLVDTQTGTIKLVRENKPNEFEKEFGLGIRNKINNFIISYRIEYYKKGDFFGIINLPPLKKDKLIDMYHQYLNLNYSKFLNDNLKINLDIGAKYYQWEGEFRIFPVDFNFSNPDSDLIEGANVKECEIYLKNNYTYNSQNHISNFLLEVKYSKPLKNNYFQYIEGEPKEERDLFLKKVDRKIYSIALEDLAIIKNNFSIIYGGRYSYYSDFKGDFSYKLGSVYNFDDTTTFKILFNTAFRAPSWVELYANTAASFNGNPNLKPEKIKMLEISWLQSFSNDKLKFTIYRGKSKNYIGRAFSESEQKRVYKNLGDMLIKGFEISYKNIYTKGQFNINYSFNNNKALFSSYIGGVDYYKYLGARKHLIKGYNIYNFNSNLSSFIGIIYGSKIDIPKMEDIDEYFTVNLNLSYKNDGLEFIIGANNITNHKNYYFILPTDFIDGRYFFIQEDASMPIEDRKIYISITKKW